MFTTTSAPKMAEITIIGYRRAAFTRRLFSRSPSRYLPICSKASSSCPVFSPICTMLRNSREKTSGWRARLSESSRPERRPSSKSTSTSRKAGLRVDSASPVMDRTIGTPARARRCIWRQKKIRSSWVTRLRRNEISREGRLSDDCPVASIRTGVAPESRTKAATSAGEAASYFASMSPPSWPRAV